MGVQSIGMPVRREEDRMPLWCLPSQVCQGVLITCLSHPLSSMRAGAGPRSGTGSVGACQRSGIEDLVSDCAVAAGMTAICFYGRSHFGLGYGARLEVRGAALNLFDGAGDDIRADPGCRDAPASP
jgi:hypothetical protein